MKTTTDEQFFEEKSSGLLSRGKRRVSAGLAVECLGSCPQSWDSDNVDETAELKESRDSHGEIEVDSFDYSADDVHRGIV
ncbi:hypothetical protein J6590_073630 [Homalodisca vitripennis]|nr:hypothetical protein J6590_073630 [Homalodisca vitripennis]